MLSGGYCNSLYMFINCDYVYMCVLMGGPPPPSPEFMGGLCPQVKYIQPIEFWKFESCSLETAAKHGDASRRSFPLCPSMMLMLSRIIFRLDGWHQALPSAMDKDDGDGLGRLGNRGFHAQEGGGAQEVKVRGRGLEEKERQASSS